MRMPYMGMFTSTSADMSRTNLNWNTADTVKTRLKWSMLNLPSLMTPKRLKVKMASTVKTV